MTNEVGGGLMYTPETHKRSALYMLAHDEWCSHDEADDGIPCDCHLSVIATLRKRLKEADLRLKEHYKAEGDAFHVLNESLRKRLEEAEKGVLLAISEWSTWKDVLLSNMKEADWQETMDGLRAALAKEETITDDCGNTWSATCQTCGGKMSVVRPGKVQCENCG